MGLNCSPPKVQNSSYNQIILLSNHRTCKDRQYTELQLLTLIKITVHQLQYSCLIYILSINKIAIVDSFFLSDSETFK